MSAFKSALSILIGSAVGACGGVLAHRIVPESPIVRGLSIGERRVPDRGDRVAWLVERRDAARARTVVLRVGPELVRTTLGEVGVEIDVDATLAKAARVGHAGPMLMRVREAAAARRGAIDVPLVWKLDADKARHVLNEHAKALEKAPIDARIDLEHHTKIPDVPGEALDVERSLDQLLDGAHDDEETIELFVRHTPAKVTLDDLVRVDVTKVVSSYETTFATIGVGVGRSINIHNAASHVEGTVLMPGEIFSFNDKVGPRTKERGFALAPEIQGDDLTQGFGGGTCQMSSTLHAASLFAALEIVERQSHSRPSAYTSMGLDATVSFPLADLKIRNTLPFPVLFHTSFPKPTVIRVEILGGDPIAKVSYSYGVGGTEDFMRRVVVKNFLEPGKRIRHQKGSRGYDVTSVVSIHFFDGRVEEKHYFSGYRPAPEIFWVAPGYDVAELPPLPDHAKGVEGSPSG